MGKHTHGQAVLRGRFQQQRYPHRQCPDAAPADSCGAASALIRHIQLCQPKPGPHRQAGQGDGHPTPAGRRPRQHPPQIYRGVGGVHGSLFRSLDCAGLSLRTDGQRPGVLRRQESLIYGRGIYGRAHHPYDEPRLHSGICGRHTPAGSYLRIAAGPGRIAAPAHRHHQRRPPPP